MRLLQNFIKETIKTLDDQPDFFNQDIGNIEDIAQEIIYKLQNASQEDLDSHKNELQRMLMAVRIF